MSNVDVSARNGNSYIKAITISTIFLIFNTKVSYIDQILFGALRVPEFNYQQDLVSMDPSHIQRLLELRYKIKRVGPQTLVILNMDWLAMMVIADHQV